MTPARDDNTAAALGLIGMLTAIVLTFTIEPDAVSYLWFGWGGLIPLAGVSAWLAGRLCGPMFGHAGAAGWLFALVGAILSTTAGTMIAGTFVSPFLGTILAPLVVFAEILQTPFLALCWCSAMVALQLWAVENKRFSRTV